ncbi:MAG: hypothetical protein CR217_14425 [Beijerinckiaceae bacterium]|nr:MAG: hypothetical protein CR217_14425 [Beijerinckiaceae bacterium]
MYLRKSGEALSPERELLHVLDALKLQIGSYAFSAQYRQSPAPPGGAGTPARTRPPVHAAGPDNDWSVCTTWIVTRKKLWYLGDVWRQRVDYPPQGKRADPRQKMERAACSGRDKLANRFGVLRMCRRLHRAIWVAAGSLRFKIAASTFLDRKVIQETRLRG